MGTRMTSHVPASIPSSLINRYPSYDLALPYIDMTLHHVLYEDSGLDEHSRILTVQDWMMYRTIAKYEGWIVEAEADGHIVAVGAIRQIAYQSWGMVVGLDDSQAQVYYLTHDRKKDCDFTPEVIRCGERIIWKREMGPHEV